MGRRLPNALLLATITLLLIALPVFAVAYQAPLAITETDGNAYTMLPVSFMVDNDFLVDSGFMLASALDTRVETLGGLARPHMVTEDRTLVSTVVPADSQVNLYYRMGASALPAMDIVAGYNGYIGIADTGALEPLQTFELEFNGYVDTAKVHSPLIYKPGNGGLLVDVSAAGTITAGIMNADSYDVTPLVFAAWTDVDVSNYVPDGASGVVVEIDTVNNPKDTGVRKNGSTDDRRTDTQHYWAMVGLDDNGVFEVYLEDNTCHIYLRGYTDDNWVYKTNAENVSLGAFAAWTDIDVTAITSADAVGAIIEVVNLDAGVNRDAGVRKNGSTDNRYPDVRQATHTFRIVGLDDDEIFEGYAETANVDFYLIGYVTSGATFATNGTDKSLGVSTAWTDVNCSTEAPDATYLFLELSVPTSNNGMGFRENSSSDNIVTDISDAQAQAIVKADMNRVIEAYEEDHTSTSFYLIGYAEYGIYPPFPSPTYTVSTSVGGGILASGVKDVKVTGTGGGGNLVLDIDGTTNSVAIGAGVTGTTNNWRLMSPALPYMEDYNHTATGALRITYEPVTMIIGTALPDAVGADNPGTFAWGSNPAGISVTLSSLVAEDQPVPGVIPEPGVRDILPEAPTSDWFQDPDVTGSLATHPLRPLVTILSDTTTLTERQAWVWLGIAFVLLVAGLVARSVRGHHIITGVATGVAVGALVAQTIFPLWTLVFVIVAIAMGAVAERSPSL